MHTTTRRTLAALLLATAASSSSAQQAEDFLAAPDRIEWDAGGLYEGRFSDGTPFQIELSYAKPEALRGDANDIPGNAYWYPRHFTGQVLVLEATQRSGERLTLATPPWREGASKETFSIVLSPDKLGGQGSWTSATLGKQLSFKLQRSVLYRAVAVTRPYPEAQEEDPGRQFHFSAVFPLLDDRDAAAWVRTEAASCGGALECHNRITVAWRTGGLLSLESRSYEYYWRTPHGNTASTTRHYLDKGGKLVPADFGHFFAQSAACRAKASAAIVAKLRAQGLSLAEQGALGETREPKFTPLPDGIAFAWDQYEVGSYMEGAPGVFLTRAELAGCAKNLPRYEAP